MRAKLTTCIAAVAGVEKRVVAAKASEAHGRVQRVIETVRWSLERFRHTRPGARTLEEVRVILYTIDNGVRNEVLSGGYSSSERGTGRRCALDRTFLHESMVSSAYADPPGLMSIATDAMSAYNFVRSNRALGQIHATKSRPGPYEELIPVGTKCDYFSTETSIRGRGGGARKAAWHGPARMVGWVAAQGAKEAIPSAFGSGYYLLEHNGSEVRRAMYHVRISELASKFNPDLEPEFAERACEVARMVVSGESDRTIDNALLGLWGEAEKALLHMAKNHKATYVMDEDERDKGYP